MTDTEFDRTLGDVMQRELDEHGVTVPVRLTGPPVPTTEAAATILKIRTVDVPATGVRQVMNVNEARITATVIAAGAFNLRHSRDGSAAAWPASVPYVHPNTSALFASAGAAATTLTVIEHLRG